MKPHEFAEWPKLALTLTEIAISYGLENQR
jgi:hypothetical protein